MQIRIELSVTNRIGYNSQTDFSRTDSIYSRGLKADEVKNTPEGLNAHLRRLTNPELQKGDYYGFIYSPKGRRMDIYTISGGCTAREGKAKELKLVNKAYNAEAKRQGRIFTLTNGVIKDRFKMDLFHLPDYINAMASS